MEQKIKNLGFGFFVLALYILVIPMIYGTVFERFLNHENAFIANLTYLGVYIIIAFVLIFIFRKSLKEEWLRFWKYRKGYTILSAKYFVYGYVLMIVLNIIIVSIQGSAANNEELNREMLMAAPIFTAISTIIFAPIIEELAFRKSFKKLFANKYFFALFTGFLFGLAHVSSVDFSNFLETWTELLYIISYGSIGFVLGCLYYETDNIFTSILAHVFHNAFTIIILFIALF